MEEGRVRRISPGQRPEQTRLPTQKQFGHLLIGSCSEGKLWMMTGLQTRDSVFPSRLSRAVWYSVQCPIKPCVSESNYAVLHTATKGAGCSSLSHATKSWATLAEKEFGSVSRKHGRSQPDVTLIPAWWVFRVVFSAGFAGSACWVAHDSVCRVFLCRT